MTSGLPQDAFHPRELPGDCGEDCGCGGVASPALTGQIVECAARCSGHRAGLKEFRFNQESGRKSIEWAVSSEPPDPAHGTPLPSHGVIASTRNKQQSLRGPGTAVRGTRPAAAEESPSPGHPGLSNHACSFCPLCSQPPWAGL